MVLAISAGNLCRWSALRMVLKAGSILSMWVNGEAEAELSRRNLSASFLLVWLQGSILPPFLTPMRFPYWHYVYQTINFHVCSLSLTGACVLNPFKSLKVGLCWRTGRSLYTAAILILSPAHRGNWELATGILPARGRSIFLEWRLQPRVARVGIRSPWTVNKFLKLSRVPDSACAPGGQTDSPLTQQWWEQFGQ